MPERESFQLSREDLTDAVSLLALGGEADRFHTDALTSAIEEVRSDGRNVIVDISAATYMDSSMIAALVGAAEQGRRRDEPLVVVCQNERLRRSLELKGLEAILRIADNREHGLELLRADDPPSGAA